MIYITRKYDTYLETNSISNLWNITVGPTTINSLYVAYIMDQAKLLNIVINPFYFNIMNREDHHPNLTVKEYKDKCKQWDKVLKEQTIDYFIEKYNYGQKLESYESPFTIII